MLNIRKILFPTDFSDCAESAFKHAAYLADKHDAELHVLHVSDVEDISLSDRLGELRITPDEIAEQLHLPVSTGDGASSSGGNIPIIEIEKSGERAAPLILHYAETHGIDLIVMGTHGRRGPRRYMLGSVTEEVLRLAHCPVFIVRHREDQSVWGMKKILSPTDLSENAWQASRHAAALARAYGADLNLLYVIDAATLPTASVPLLGTFQVSPEAVMTRSNEALVEQARELQEEFRLPSGVGIFVRLGHPARDILEFVDENETDLLVMGSHGRSGISRMLMGSVAEQVIRNAPCPVFTVKSLGRNLLTDVTALAEEEGVLA